MSDLERLNKFFEKHGYSPATPCQSYDSIFFRFMAAVMDEFGIEVENE